ncbi:MAG: tetratricopeptide repeat protein, partial [Candidatus Sabulitectum sp.]|nr:tetratricopeptide repeat protein [Candidatus Sabulitectum sp.]
MADAFTSETYNALCRDAEGYLARGLAEQARELLLKATSLIGTRARARSLLSDACMQLTLWDEAKSQLEALATLEVDNIYTHFRLGQVLEETCEYELARDNFRVVLDMNPDHHGAKVALSRLEKISNEPSHPEPPSFTEGQQIFAYSDEDNGVFAGDPSGGIDELLNTIGMGEKKDVPGVEDLLSSIGMNHKEEKEKEKPAVDFASIFGGSEQKDDTAAESPLSDVFSEKKPEQSVLETTDIGTIFGGSEPETP